ncbi:YtpI family protein [Oceanobacillus rekensis]|jgi:prepilin signal peptidase PulO-like enzyme (type II secretory pathway)|uniref:YtpI family protein n=1 Tax=Oceanobacillus rekensis TaxID=937927 RepID=UPI000B44BAE5|nr:YtpI family protein [Oceanobacillus rekensis]
MVIFPIVIVITAVLYIYYKVAILKSNDELTQKYFNGKARLCLGTFLLFFGINQYIFYKTQLALFICLIIVLFGALQMYRGFKEARHYRNEWRRLNPNE